MSAASLVVFMTTYFMILPAITINLEQADEEPGFEVEVQGELLSSNEEHNGYEDENAHIEGDGYAPLEGSGIGEQNSFDDEGDISAFFGGDISDSDEIFFADADEKEAGYAQTSAEETAGPFEYTCTDGKIEVGITVELLDGAVLPSDARMTAKIVRTGYGIETEENTFTKAESAFAELLQAVDLQPAEEPLFLQLLFDKDGESLFTEDTYTPARIILRFNEMAPEGEFTIATGEYNDFAGKAEIRQTLLIPENSCYSAIVDLENVKTIEISETSEDETIESETEAETSREEVEATERITEAETEEAAQAIESIYEGETEKETESIAEKETESITEEETEYISEKETEESLSVLTYKGNDYTIQLAYGEEAGIPETAKLRVREIREGSSSYDSYVTGSENALGMEEGSAGYIRLFDIRIVDKYDPGVKYQPTDGTTVNVKIELQDTQNEELNVVHFASKNDTGAVVDAEVDGHTVNYEADGFSVYAIVGTVIEKTVLASDGHNYRISVTYGDDAGVPEGADLAGHFAASEG